ncbi:uncharacterized protein LOC135499448 [Lineus longissimus]|uniref:uncharacterized protein LOC135499448 n=1 Tax=Lineus longissimus TaxID=88925 RepID=UPI00315D9746
MKSSSAAREMTFEGHPVRWRTLAFLLIAGLFIYGCLDIRLGIRPTVLKQLNSFSLNFDGHFHQTNTSSQQNKSNMAPKANVSTSNGTVTPKTLPKTTPTTAKKPTKSSAKPTTKAKTKVTTKKPHVNKDIAMKIMKIKGRELAKEYREVLLDLLRTFMKIAEELNLIWFAYGGTLVGTWRHHGFVPWDDDIDILVNNSQKPGLLKKFLSMEPQYVGHDGDPIIKMFSNKSQVKIKDSNHRWPFIDILFFVENGDKIWDNLKYMDKYKFKKSDIFPTHKRPFENVMINAPKNALKILLPQYYWINPSHCSTWNYDHRTESGGRKRIEIPCEALKDVYPFVHREYIKGNEAMKETLKLGEKVIQTKYVEEMESSRTPPFTLKPAK